MKAFLLHGRLGGWAYLLWGALLLLVKQVADRALAARFGQRWNLVSYWAPLPGVTRIVDLTGSQRDFLLAMAALSVPFILAGTALTLARLRSAKAPLWMVVFFFLPVLNLVFFLVLASLASHDRAGEGAGENGMLRSGIVAVLATTSLAVLAALWNARGLQLYGAGLFLALPFCLGMLASLIYGFRQRRTLQECLRLGVFAALAPALALLLFAIEGLGCLMMAMPLAVPLVLAGSWTGWAIQAIPGRRLEYSVLLWPLVFSPLFCVLEGRLQAPPPLLEVQSSIEIAAPPEAVWREVVAFSEIDEPAELLFHTGIAYPLRARMEGQGAGAIRQCEFTTGAFLEPIEVWDEPRLLRFSVARSPAPLEEWSPYGSIDTPHLHGILQSRRGQFRLTALPGGRTLLEGTTWYTQSLAPTEYWSRWSNTIIHRIHMRVLNHIQHVVEARYRSGVAGDRVGLVGLGQ